MVLDRAQGNEPVAAPGARIAFEPAAFAAAAAAAERAALRRPVRVARTLSAAAAAIRLAGGAAAAAGTGPILVAARCSPHPYGTRRALALTGLGQTLAGHGFSRAASAAAGLSGAGAAVAIHRTAGQVMLRARRAGVAIGLGCADDNLTVCNAHDAAWTANPSGTAAQVIGSGYAGIAAQAACTQGKSVYAFGQLDRGLNFPRARTAATRAAATIRGLLGSAGATTPAPVEVRANPRVIEAYLGRGAAAEA